jgi:transcriptional regulator with XRE-family HTH domain
MTDNSFAGPMSMVKIDGGKIKQLREQQGLTQLYLATAVEVTTDTISRWENRRYPSIKRDNGLKLAEALNVPLEEILEETPLPPEEREHSGEAQFQENSSAAKFPFNAGSGIKKSWPLLILSGTLLSIILAFIWYFIHFPPSRPLTAERIVPAHSIAGQPFPVIIKVTGAPDTDTALIIKETLASDLTVRATSPPVSAGGLKNNQIKWLKKIRGSAFFVYVASVTGKEGTTVNFNGTAAISNDPEAAIIGENTMTIGRYHWADTNKDSVISDDEILAVYDQYSGISDIDFDIDLIEEIWLGSAYRWDAASAKFIIMD